MNLCKGQFEFKFYQKFIVSNTDCMKDKESGIPMPNQSENKANVILPGYPIYPVSEDIYSRSIEEKDVDPEETTKLKVANDNSTQMNEKDFADDVSGSDLDIPGSELDDELEIIGSEDEENNLYSIGGDNHNDLEEDKGD